MAGKAFAGCRGIRRAGAGDAARLEEICNRAFKLTSFHTDPLFPSDAAARAVWHLYGVPALRAEKPPCFVAETDSGVAGFVIYGGYGELSRIISRKTGNIVLLTVDPEFQGQGFGRDLLRSLLTYLAGSGTERVTVGTDALNAPALRLYESFGFVRALNWKTWRLYGTGRGGRSGKEERPLPAGPGQLALSLFLEEGILETESRDAVRKMMESRIPSGEPLVLQDKGAVCVLERQEILTELCGFPFTRISGLHGEDETSSVGLFGELRERLAERTVRGEKFGVEVFVKSGRRVLEEGLTSGGFLPVHEAVSLQGAP